MPLIEGGGGSLPTDLLRNNDIYIGNIKNQEILFMERLTKDEKASHRIGGKCLQQLMVKGVVRLAQSTA